MYVYIPMCEWPYEGYTEPLKAFTTREKALAFIKALPASAKKHRDWEVIDLLVE